MSGDWVQDAGERDLQHRICTGGSVDLSLRTEFVRHNFVHKTEFVDNNLEFAKQMTKNKRSEFDDRIGIVHRICTSQFSAQNRICGQQFEVRI